MKTTYTLLFKYFNAGISIPALLILGLFSQATFAKEDVQVMPKVKFETTNGSFVLELYPQKAPVTVANFLKYVDDKFYEGTIFHRVIPNFVVQGGGMDYNFKKRKTRETILNESDNGLKNEEAFLSMARTADPNSATSQFFINLKHNENLDYKKSSGPGYAVFAKVIDGFETIKKIEREPRGLYRTRPEAPNYPVIVEKVYRVKE